MHTREIHPIDSTRNVEMTLVLDRLVSGLKPALTCLISGQSDSTVITDWQAQISAPDKIEEDRLRLAYWALTQLSAYESDAAAYATLIGSCPWLDNRSPAVLIRTSDPRLIEPDIRDAVYGIIEGGPA